MHRPMSTSEFSSLLTFESFPIGGIVPMKLKMDSMVRNLRTLSYNIKCLLDGDHAAEEGNGLYRDAPSVCKYSISCFLFSVFIMCFSMFFFVLFFSGQFGS